MNPAIKSAKEARSSNEEYISSNGIKLRIEQVSQLLIEEAVRNVPRPRVPIKMDEMRGYEIENPNDPNYLADMEEYEGQQGKAAVDAIVIWGIHLVDGMPEDESWLKQLKLFSRRGNLDLSEYDLDDELDREFLYKRFIAITGDELDDIMEKAVAGVTTEDIDLAKESFKSDPSGSTD